MKNSPLRLVCCDQLANPWNFHTKPLEPAQGARLFVSGEFTDASECGFNHRNATDQEDFNLDGVGAEALASVLLYAVEVVPQDGEEVAVGLDTHGVLKQRARARPRVEA
jgi:hypothetical protein